jgi:D-glycero-alpha-D-manno-heptose 1-phosphate guanylyltransferase
MSITSLREETPLGTGGAIYSGLKKVQGESAFIVNGDTYFPADLAAFQAAAQRLDIKLAVALRRLEDTSRYGAVELEQGLIARVNEKGRSGPGLVNAGLYLLPRELWRSVPMPDVFSWELDFLQPLAPALGTAGVVLDAPFLDIGTPESYARAESMLPPLGPEATRS